jgi:biopolymer transport protein ExbD
VRGEWIVITSPFVSARAESERSQAAARRSAARSVVVVVFVVDVVPVLSAVALGFLVAACSKSVDSVALGAACDAGSADACEVLAARHLLGEGAPKDEAKAVELGRRVLELRTKACSEGDADACAKMSRIVVSTPLDLPRAPPSNSAGAQPGEPASAQLVLGIELYEDGRVLVNGAPVSGGDAALVPLFAEQVKRNPDLRAVIRADANVKHGRVITMLDLLKQAGVTKIAFGVNSAGSAPPPGSASPPNGSPPSASP